MYLIRQHTNRLIEAFPISLATSDEASISKQNPKRKREREITKRHISSWQRKRFYFRFHVTVTFKWNTFTLWSLWFTRERILTHNAQTVDRQRPNTQKQKTHKSLRIVWVRVSGEGSERETKKMISKMFDTFAKATKTKEKCELVFLFCGFDFHWINWNVVEVSIHFLAKRFLWLHYFSPLPFDARSFSSIDCTRIQMNFFFGFAHFTPIRTNISLRMDTS